MQKFQPIYFIIACVSCMNLATVAAQDCTNDAGWSSLSTNPYSPRLSGALGIAADFNLFAFGNADLQSSDVEGRTAIGGNANFISGFNIAQGISNNGYTFPNNCSSLNFIVGGNITGNGAQGNGAARYGGSASSTFYNNSGCGIAQQGGILDFGAARTDLRAKSTAWGALAANCTTTYNSGSHLQLSGNNSGVNIFTVTNAQLNGVYQIYLDIPTGSSAFINVAGTSADPGDWMEFRVGTPASYTLADNNTAFFSSADEVRSRTLWNFFEATTLNISNIGWQGSVLAPFANFSGTNGNLNGNLVVENITSTGAQTIQINCRPFRGCTPTATPTCNNITNAGSIGSDASGCAPFDPPLINSFGTPSGGSGALEIIWIYKNTSTGGSFWQISGANGLTYNPGVITETTIFRRCSRRAGCTDFVGESNDVTMTVGTAPTFNITNARCTQGINTTDTNDDRWSLDITATAGTPSAAWYQILYNGNVIESGVYGTPKMVDMGLISNYSTNASLTIRDADYNSCTALQSITVPTGCSPASCVGFTFANKSVVCNGTTITVCYDVQGTGGRYWGANVKYTNDVNNHGYMVGSGTGDQTGICHTITDPTQVADITAFSNSNGGNLLLWGMLALSNGDMINGTGCAIDQFIPFSCCTNTGATISGNTAFCAGSTTTLTAAGGNTYAWSNGSTTAAINPTTAGTYTVTAMTGNCTATASVTVIVNAAPTVSASSATICTMGSANITATATPSANTTYIWNTGSTAASIWTMPNATTTYTVTATAANGCTGTTEATVTVREAIINVSLTANNVTSCSTNNGSIIVNATGNSGTLQYRINGGAWQTSNTFSNLAVGDFIVEVSYVGNYCTYTFAQVSLTAPSSTTVTVTNQAICAMGSTNITATATPSVGTTYVWNTGSTTESIWTMPNATTTYTVTATAANGCTASTTGIVTVNALPAANVTTSTGGTSVCIGASLNLTAEGGTSYVWSTGSTATTIAISQANTYTVTVTNASGCTKSTTIVITTTNAVSAEILTEGVICGSGSVAMTAQTGTSFVWSTGAIAATITVSNTGIYTVTVTNAGGCTATATTEIIHDILPIITITSGTGSTNVCENTPINISAYSGQAIAYLWNTGAITATISVTPTATTTYTVTVTTPKGCTATATFTLTTKVCGTASIGNFVWFDGTNDTSNSAQDTGEGGVAEVTVTLYDENKNVLAITATNGRGYYIFENLFAGNYSVGFTPLAGLAFVNQTLNTTNGSDADSNTGITPIFALANGQQRTDIDAGLKQTDDLKGSLGNKVWYDNNKNGIQDNNEAGVANVTINLFGTNGTTLLAATTTNALGEYIFTNLDPTGYRVQFVLPVNRVFTAQNVGEDQADSDADFATGMTEIITLTKGENNTTVDAGIFDPTAGTASVGDFVWNDKNLDGIQGAGERGVVGIKVTLLAADGTTVIALTFTNENGYYLFSGLNAGDYMVAFSGLPNNFIFTTTTLNTPNGSDANSIGRTPVFSVSNGETKRDIDAGIFDNGIAPRDAASIGNFVWSDTDGNGRQDTNEPGVSGILVTLYDGNNNFIAKTTTNRDGFYEFLGLPAGSYYVIFSDLPQDVIFTGANNTPDDTRDSDADATTGRTQTINLAGGENNLTLDAGLVIKAVLGDFVWIDTNIDGKQSVGESGVSSLIVELYLASDLNTPVQTTTTDDNGIYYFKVSPATYIVKFADKATFSRTVSANGGDNDSDANTATGLTAPITIAAGQRNYTIDAGYYSSPLPVKLIYFVGAAQNCSVILKWQTATELNNKTFVIQRSTDGLSFVTIATINGAGTTNTPHNYEVEDEKPSRKNYYRMLQIDFDGTTTTYSSTNVVHTNGCFDQTNNGIDAIFPNPNATSTASVKFYTEQIEEEVNIEISDALGRVILSIPANIYTGANVISFDISNLVAGNYAVRIKGNNWFTTAQKLIRM